MRKKIVILLMISVLAISGCSKDDTSGSTSEPKSEIKTDTEATKSPDTASSIQETSTPDPEETSESPTKDNESSIEDIEKYMLDKGVVSGQKTQMAAEMVGAINGFKYSDSNVEVYEYDVNSKNYKALAKGKKIPLEGFDGYEIGAVSVNGKFVLIGEPSKDAIKAFDSFKTN